MAGRPAGQFAFLHQNDIRPAGQRQVIQDAASGDTTTNNNDSCLMFNSLNSLLIEY
jgi:hypothetical protein